MSSQPTLLIVPGWRNSGPGHWQSLWAQQLGDAVRVQMAEEDWNRPRRSPGALLVAPADPERLQNAGHINVESGHGEWPLGLALLQSLMAGHTWSAQPQTELESA